MSIKSNLIIASAASFLLAGADVPPINSAIWNWNFPFMIPAGREENSDEGIEV